ncbi:MAG: cobalamin B12-binding domain-containing protein [Theionarchaea archaeon]|nr:cobalamin B12-binding domain-containing protein [Theionarchaea archaeon]
MKTLLVRPGSEVVERTLRGPWPPELNHLSRLYREHGVLYRGLAALQILSHSSTLAVGTKLKNMGEDVAYLDVPLEFGVPLTEEMNRVRHEKVEDFIAEGRYDVVGISCTSSSEAVAAREIAGAAKKVSPDICVVVGGYQATAEARSFMEKIPAIDVVVLSDFEPIAEQLYKSLDEGSSLKGISNIMYREKKDICVSERKHIKLNPEDLPVFDYSLVERYMPFYVYIALESSRGCPYKCSYCQEKVLRNAYTAKAPDIAADELISTANYVLKFSDLAIIFYSDALWGLNPKWVKSFSAHVVERRDEIKTDKYGWIVEARVGQFDEEALTLMKKAGCMSVGYGVESFSLKMLTLMNKTEDPKKYIGSVFNSVEETKKAGIQPALFFLFGLPGETPETLQETVDTIRKLPTIDDEDFHIGPSLAHPYPSTLLDEQIHDPAFVAEYGVKILDENDWEKCYIPRLTMLFDPSRTLSAVQMADFYLKLVHGDLGIPVIEKRLQAFKDVRNLSDKNEISPADFQRYVRILRRIAAEHIKGGT